MGSMLNREPVPTGESELALVVDHVTKTFRIHSEKASSLKQFIATGGRNRYEDFYALRDISFEVEVGSAVGIIGHNGSGKSTLLKCMAQILTPNEGSITVNKRMAALLELGAGFHPELSGRDNVFLNAAILGMARKEIAERFDEIVDFSGLHDFIDAPVKTYSSGMYVRLAFAVAINVDPDLLLIDEILAVGDVTFQQKCMEKFARFREEGRTLVLVTHDTGSVRHFCDRAIWIDHGQIKADGEPAAVIDEYNENMLGGEENPEGGGIRRGDGPIRVTSVEMLVGGRPTDRFRTGDDVTFRLHYESSRAIQKPVFAITINSLAGPVVTAPASRDVDQVPTALGGTGHVDIAIRDVPLLPGPYVLHTEITKFGRASLFDHLQNAFSFDVIAGTSAETTGFITLHPTWTIEGNEIYP
ncbi:MAG: ABC transporter ATP-binding protein [Ilumatobacter sp.]|jgi:lipopolysaccharide transport system ATP-binding protein|uniref:ABC transporter ATP-binding protein n=1 Tax=Ilumatobacter sp. TaxID=1967498 RepID=UPI00391CBC4B